MIKRKQNGNVQHLYGSIEDILGRRYRKEGIIMNDSVWDTHGDLWTILYGQLETSLCKLIEKSKHDD